MKRLIVVLLLAVIVTNADAQKSAGHKGREYHVAVNGSDSNDGDINKPFKTIMMAASAAMPGDVITVHGGVYREEIVPPRGGSAENERITYAAAKGEKVEIKGSEIVKGWKKLTNDTWELKLPNSFFGKFNPFKALISGDWFTPTPKERKYHRGAVYLNGDWLMEAASADEVMKPADKKNQLWWGDVDSITTTIRAQFKDVDPNREMVEVNVRQTVFYPDKPFINFITVRGFIMEHAATNWAPPTAGQMGLIGTHWSRGWIIENNTVQYSKCVGISLGKYGDEFDNRDTESAEGYVGTIKRALSFGWNKGTVGGHLVRNNHVAYCEQAGIVGSMGCSFSTVTGNSIHDIHVRKLFTGAEMAAIKFHGAIDVQISGNHIYRSCLGIWLDWMAQGAQIKSNLMHDNENDIFIEVCHGPTLVSNNILLSKQNVYLNSSGIALVHNLFSGEIGAISYDGRLTPYQLPHSTYMANLHDNPGGDVQFLNNLFVGQANVSQYSEAFLPVVFKGNVYTKGTVRATGLKGEKSKGEMNENAKQLLKRYKAQPAAETDILVKSEFDPGVSLQQKGKDFFLEISTDKEWLSQKRTVITTTTLTKAVVPDLPFENTDGSVLRIDTDFTGKKRNAGNPSPGPFEITGTGKQSIKVW
ncbi:MAG: right-handed parallel beta-helix repeat-containing protein [Chitinophaga sp.]|uniref:right-handed parallel beta-helix repeat-containing protein n=1 Tax=Chitinophaga sp. TaxID=1869181 RepID=UPI001B1DFDF5|nr:right-handed parallel beta-helix repeat-containing protein [Chitinophaga sp.]MBO9732412.1 right-handed parallel beta-helix repeat-containing protein [Chitinophaga sp.]